MSKLLINETDGCLVIVVKVIPASSRTMIGGILNGMLKIKVSTAPERGKANKELLDFLAKKIGTQKKCIEIISGKNSPVKQIQIHGVSKEELVIKLGIQEQGKD